MLTWFKSRRAENQAQSEQPSGSGTLAPLIVLALILLAGIAALIQFQHHLSTAAVEPGPMTTDPLASEIARCRTITPEQLAADDICRRVWAEGRRRFFAPSASRRSPGTTEPATTEPSVSPKIQDRIPSSPDRGEPIEAR
jgi:conjugative transfer region protein TrbK